MEREARGKRAYRLAGLSRSNVINDEAPLIKPVPQSSAKNLSLQEMGEIIHYRQFR